MLHSAGAWREKWGERMCGEIGSGYVRREKWKRGCVERFRVGMFGGRNEREDVVEEACRTEATMVNLPHLKSRRVHHL